MPDFNVLVSLDSIDNMYQMGYLPQRNDKNFFYFGSSSRSDLSKYHLSSENRRVLKKTDFLTYEFIDLCTFDYTPTTQLQIFNWIKKLGWDFPIFSVKKVFTNHMFNKLYIWKQNDNVVGYSICLFESSFSHIAYVFYDSSQNISLLSIRMVLQFVIDSKNHNLNFAYLGNFSQTTGFYKRTMPGFQVFSNNTWIDYYHSMADEK